MDWVISWINVDKGLPAMGETVAVVWKDLYTVRAHRSGNASEWWWEDDHTGDPLRVVEWWGHPVLRGDNQEETMTTARRIIKVGDVIRHRGHVDTVKAVYAGVMRGEFKCIGGTFRQARAILVLDRDSGHYPVGDDIELLLPEDADEEGRYPVGGLGRSRPTEHVCEPSRFEECWVWCHRHREHFAYQPEEEIEYVCEKCEPSDVPLSKSRMLWCDKCGKEVWHLPRKQETFPEKELWGGVIGSISSIRPPEEMEYVCRMCNPSVGIGKPTVMRRCPEGKGDLMPHVLVPKQ